MLPPRTVITILTVGAIFGVPSPLGAADERLQRIIDNIRANETIYENLEAEITRTYTLNTAGVTAPPPYAWRSSSSTMRSVLQGQFFYFRNDGTATLVNNTTPPLGCTMGYDGEYTRRVEGKTANLIRGPSGHCQLFRAHTWLLGKPRVCFPLSVWLASGKELHNHPGAGQYKENWILEAFYEKAELIDGLQTVKVRAEVRDRSGEINFLCFLWLATDRNYLPVKVEGFVAGYSKTLPLEIGRATDFREVAPGVWLPFRCSIVVYDELKVAENKVVVSNTTEATLTRVDLNPHYDLSLFRDIPIPDGTRVYEVNDAEIVNSYTHGEKTDPNWQAPKASRWRLRLVGAAVVLVLVGGVVAYRWRSRRRNRMPATA